MAERAKDPGAVGVDRAAIYARVSTSEQVKGYSIDSQLEKCRDYAATLGLTVVNEYVDAGSGTGDKRKGFQRMVQNGVAGIFKTIIVYSFDRFARNMEHAVVYKSLLKREGVQVLSVIEPVDQESPFAFVHEGIVDLFAAFYSVNLSAKIKSGQAKSIEKGKWPHIPPSGYIKKDGWVEVAETGAGIQRAFKEFATGKYTLGTWTEAARQMGITWSSGRKIAMSTWSKIFNNRFYVGVLSWGDQSFKGLHEPLIDQETFDQVQAVLRGNENSAKHYTYRHYLLKGLVYSEDACSQMVGATGKTNMGGWKYYRSTMRRPDGTKHSIPAEVLEGQVEKVLESVVVAPQDLEGLKLDESLLLALRVSPHLGAVYHWLKTDKERQYLLNLVVSKYGLKVSGSEIVTIDPLPPFCFKLTFAAEEKPVGLLPAESRGRKKRNA